MNPQTPDQTLQANALRWHGGCFRPQPVHHHAGTSPAPRVAELAVSP